MSTAGAWATCCFGTIAARCTRGATSIRRRTAGCGASPSRATARARSLEQSRDPALHALRIGDIRFAEARRKAALVAQRAKVEPPGAGDNDHGGKERLEGERNADHVDDVSQVHRVSRPCIDAGFDKALG